MTRVPAVFTLSNLDTERTWRKCAGPFRKPPCRFTASQMSSEMALAACGVLYLDTPHAFSQTALKHAAYLYRHMSKQARPTVVLAFSNTHDVEGDAFFSSYFQRAT